MSKPRFGALAVAIVAVVNSLHLARAQTPAASDIVSAPGEQGQSGRPGNAAEELARSPGPAAPSVPYLGADTGKDVSKDVLPSNNTGSPGLAQLLAAAPKAPTNVYETVEVIAKRLDEARNALSPDTGSAIYRFDQKDIAALPQGDDTPLNQVILQAPGAAQDSFGQIHVRGDHANLQYRINGVVIPEPIAGFGQALDARFAGQISLLTGALPAQYGYRTAGVIDIHTRAANPQDGGSLGITGGSHGTQEVGAELTGTKGKFTYLLSGDYLRNDLGIENPTPDRNALHDASKQGKSLAYISYLLGPASRLSMIFGTSDNSFQIPDQPGLTPTFTLSNGVSPASANLDARQDETNRFQILTYQGTAGANADFQVSLTHRYSDVHYQPDPLGDLLFNGIAGTILRKTEAEGLQSDGSYSLGRNHTLRAGLFLQRERFAVDNSSVVFPADAQGNQTSTNPFTIVDNSHQTGNLYGVYLQDEWQPVSALTVNYGARYDKVNALVAESQLSPRLGLVYDLSSAARIHAGYSRYFTPPPSESIDTTTVQKYLGTTNAPPSTANTAVKSERSNYFDVGVSDQLTPAITVGIDGYYRQVEHLQDEGQFGNALIFSAFNYQKGKVYGTELSGTYHQGNLSGYANAAYSVALGQGIETGQFNFAQDELDYIASHWVHLDHDQRWSASTGISYLWGDTTYSGDLIYGSGLRRGFANSEHLPGYAQVNVAATHTFTLGSLGKVETRFTVLNLLDKSYEIRDGSGIGVGAPQWGPRRAYSLTLSKPF